MSRLTLLRGDNLASLRALVAAGELFDLVEIDGPYGAGLESWDVLNEREYLAHYAERLQLVRRVLHPHGVVFLFGWPEGCADLKVWCHNTETLQLRRWLNWHVQSTKHAGRRIQTILLLISPPTTQLLAEFRLWLRNRRRIMGLTVEQAHQATGIRPQARGGFLWFESETSRAPTREEYQLLQDFFTVPDSFNPLHGECSFTGLTDIDFITVPVERATHLNVAGLRSKPMGLYEMLFRPVLPVVGERKALILYGGSGNAGYVAGHLGYDVTLCESDPARCDLIVRQWDWHLHHRDRTPSEDLGPIFQS